MSSLLLPLTCIWAVFLAVAVLEHFEARNGILRVFTIVFGVPVIGITTLILLTEMKELII